MPTVTVSGLGTVGYIADKEPTAIPPNGFNFMQNMRCRDGSLTQMGGHTAIATISVAPQTLASVKSAQRTYLTYADNDSIYSISAEVEENISGYTYSTGGRWDSNILGGVAIFNNGLDNPQYWGGAGLALDLPYDSTDESNVCYWKDVGMTAQILRTFKYHVFALDINDCSGRNRRRIWWSHPAAPGTVPITWDINKADFDARDAELTETSGYILDALTLRDTLQIYLDDAIYSVTYTGRQDRQIFDIKLQARGTGIYARNCVCDIGGKHFLVSDGDIYLYDGTNLTSIADERIKDLFFNGVSRSFYSRSYCAYYHRTGEVWLCYPEANDEFCTKALVWDKHSNTWSQKNVPDTKCAVFAIVDRSSGYTWSSLPYATWADWGTNPSVPLWNIWVTPIDNSPISDSLIIGGDGVLWEQDSGNQADGVNMECIARRTHLDLGDKADFHMVTAIYPKVEGDPIQVRIGSHNVIGEAIVWEDYQTFTPGVDYVLYFRSTGRLQAVEFYSNDDVSSKVEGYDVDFAIVGRR